MSTPHSPHMFITSPIKYVSEKLIFPDIAPRVLQL